MIANALLGVGAAVPVNQAPTVGFDISPVVVNEGDTANNSGTYSDSNSGDNVTITADIGTITGKTGTNSGTWSWSFDTTDGPAQSGTVKITAADGNGAVTDTTFTLTVNNVAPANVTLEATARTINENQSVTLTGSFTDPGSLDTHTVVIEWGDGTANTTLNLAARDLDFSRSHQYLDDNPTGTSSDDYIIKIVSLTDSDGATVGTGGNIFLTGHDPDFHAQTPSDAGARNLLKTALGFVTSGTYDDNNPNTKFLWVESRPGAAASGHAIGETGLTAIGLAVGVDYDRANAAELPSVDFSDYTAIAVASAFGGMLTRAELDALILRSEDIKTFVNNGGGLFAGSECDNCGSDILGTNPDLFGFLPINVSSINASGSFTVTAFGASLGLTNGDVNSPTHNSFADAGGLKIVDNDTAGKPTTLAANVLVGETGLSQGLTVTVNNVAPTVDAPDIPTEIIASQQVTVSPITITDDGPDTFTATVDWGDGSPLDILGDVVTGFRASYTYSAPNVYTVIVTVTDDDGGVGVDTLAIKVIPDNQPPVCQDVSFDMNEDTTVLRTPLCSDPDGDTIDIEIVSFSLVSVSPNKVKLPSGLQEWEISLPLNFNGSGASYTYRANDGQVDSNTATATITVIAVNDAPVANPGDPYTGFEGSPVSFDGGASSDVDVGDTLTFEWTFAPNGTGTGVSPSHIFADNGPPYEVCLTVTDNGSPPLSSDNQCTRATISNVAPALGTGKVVVNNDEWTFSDDGFTFAPTAAQFARNVADYFTGGAPGNFLAYSTNFGLKEKKIALAMGEAGHSWTVTTAVPFTLATLQQYDAVFLMGDAADNQVLIDYVNAGGNVYLGGGTGIGGAPAEAPPRRRPVGTLSSTPLAWNSRPPITRRSAPASRFPDIHCWRAWSLCTSSMATPSA